MASYCQLVATATLLLVILVGEGFALECIECNSYRDSLCDSDPIQFKTQCNASAVACRKMEQEIYYEDDYHVRTIRQCAYESVSSNCIERIGTYRFKVFYCHCTGDNCNGAGSLSISLVLAVMSSVAVLLLKL